MSERLATLILEVLEFLLQREIDSMAVDIRPRSRQQASTLLGRTEYAKANMKEYGVLTKDS